MKFEDRTLTEIKDHHDDNWAYIQKAIVRKSFPSIIYAIQYRTHAFTAAIDSLGFNPATVISLATSRDTAENVIDNMLKKQGIVIEDWSRTDVEESRRGLYVYKDNEIAYYISDITREGVTIDNFIIATNVKV